MRKSSTLRRTPLKKVSPKRDLAKEKEEQKKQRNDDAEFYLHIWEKRNQISDLTGRKMTGECMSSYMHHLLPKEQYPHLRYEEDNILLCEAPLHAQIEFNPSLLQEPAYSAYLRKLEIAEKKFL